LKIFKNVNLTLNLKLKRELDQQASMLRQIDTHANIIKFFDYFSLYVPNVGHMFYFVSEYHQNGSLDMLLAERQFTSESFEVDRIVKWMNDLLDVIQYLHVTKGIIHRDITPG